MKAVAHTITIELEEHFQLAHGSQAIARSHWDRLPSRVEQNVASVLDLLKKTGVTATFFAHPWIAEKHPDLVRKISDDGHEVGCKFDRHSLQDPEGARALVEAASGKRALGCRIERDPSISGELHKRVADTFDYESSLVDRAAPAQGGGCPVPGITIAGQAWSKTSLFLRQRTQSGASRMIENWAGSQVPLPLSFKVWELDSELPRLAGMSSLRRWLSYRNLAQFPERVRTLLSAVKFEAVRDSLGLQEVPVSVPEPVIESGSSQPKPIDIPVTELAVVVPYFNEDEGLPYLAKTLRSLEEDAAGRCELSFVLVDDGSTDGTWAVMERLFSGRRAFKLIKHERNRGVAAAMLTGISACETEIVAVMDSDCSYEPSSIWAMLQSLKPGVAAVTGSPYHADGGVFGVPEWRLAISRSASAAYRILLRNKLATYTSCFRVYRRRAVERVSVQNDGFLGVTELLVRLDLDGWLIAEHPVVLQSRIFGRSKIKVLRTTIAHMKLMIELALLRFARGSNPHTKRLSSKDLERLP